MAVVVITMKIMPTSPDVDVEKLYEKVVPMIQEESGYTDESSMRKTIEEVAFGLKSLTILFLYPEEKGSPDELEKKINEIPEVESAEIVDVRRTLG